MQCRTTEAIEACDFVGRKDAAARVVSPPLEVGLIFSFWIKLDPRRPQQSHPVTNRTMHRYNSRTTPHFYNDARTHAPSSGGGTSAGSFVFFVWCSDGSNLASMSYNCDLVDSSRCMSTTLEFRWGWSVQIRLPRNGGLCSPHM